MSFLILFMARSIDPFGVAVALICGAMAPRWWQTPLVGIVVAAGLETGLTSGQMGVSRRTAMRLVSQLIERGWLERHKITGSANHYYLTLPEELKQFVTGAATMSAYLRDMTTALSGQVH